MPVNQHGAQQIFRPVFEFSNLVTDFWLKLGPNFLHVYYKETAQWTVVKIAPAAVVFEKNVDIMSNFPQLHTRKGETIK